MKLLDVYLKTIPILTKYLSVHLSDHRHKKPYKNGPTNIKKLFSANSNKEKLRLRKVLAIPDEDGVLHNITMEVTFHYTEMRSEYRGRHYLYEYLNDIPTANEARERERVVKLIDKHWQMDILDDVPTTDKTKKEE